MSRGYDGKTPHYKLLFRIASIFHYRMNFPHSVVFQRMSSV